MQSDHSVRNIMTARKARQLSKVHQPELSTNQDPRAIRSREALRRAFLELLETRPLEQITVQEITEAAGVSYVTFFRHHATKEFLLNEIAAQQIRRLVDLTLPIFDARDTRAASVALCAYVDEHRALWCTLLTGGAAAALREEYIRVSREVAQTRTKSDAWCPPDIAGILVVSSTLELLTWWLRQKRPVSIEKVAEIHYRAIISPVISTQKAGNRRT
jgi:AcrR family transcriptional regulator